MDRTNQSVNMKAVFRKFVLCFIIVLGGCSSDIIKTNNVPPNDEDRLVDTRSSSESEELTLEHLSDDEQVQSLVTSGSKLPPESQFHAIYECEDEYTDLCTWYEVPDSILMGEVLSARPTTRFFRTGFRGGTREEVESCEPDSISAYSIEIELKPTLIIKGENPVVDSHDSVRFVIDGFTLSKWQLDPRTVIADQIRGGDEYVLKGVIEQGQTLGVSLFSFDDGWTPSEAPLFIVREDPEGKYLLQFQNVIDCRSLTPRNHEGIEIHEFLTAIDKCMSGDISPRPNISAYQRSRMEKDGFGMNRCF